MKDDATAGSSEAWLSDAHTQRQPDAWIFLALFVVFFALYTHSVSINSANLYWYNFIFDADVGRVISDAEHGQNPIVFERHPLFVLTIGSLASLANQLLGDFPYAVLVVIACIGAMGVALSYIVFLRVCRNQFDAILFTLFYGFAATTWLLSSIPEIFGLNATIIVASFLFHRPCYARPLKSPFRFAVNILYSTIAIGMTVSNIFYVGLAYLSNTRRAQENLQQRIGSTAFYVGAVVLVFLALSWTQGALYPDRIEHDTGYTSFVSVADKDPFFDFNRDIVSMDTLRSAQAFLVDNLIAAPPVVKIIDTREGALQMIQFGGPLQLSYLAALGLLLGLIAATMSRAGLGYAVRSHTAQLALAYLVFNLVFHFFYRGNGDPFIYSIHALLPVLVLLAHVYSPSQFRYRHPFALIVLLVMVANNATFMTFVDRALSLQCKRKLDHVCLEWNGVADDTRYYYGLDAFLKSPNYAFALGGESIASKLPLEAIAYYRRVLPGDKKYALARRNLGYMLIHFGSLAEGVKHLDWYLQRYEGDAAQRKTLDDARSRLQGQKRGPP